MAGETGGTTSRTLNKLQYDAANKAAAIGTAATTDRFLIADVSDDYEIKYAVGTDVLVAAGVTATAAEINNLDNSAAVMTAGAGIAGAETYASGVFQNGDIIITRIVIDLTDLVVDDADLDIIGDDDAASANFGQITTALNGTIVGGKMTCLEVPAGAADDIDLYSATEGTGQEGVASGVGSLTETALVTSGAAWTSGRTLGMTALPAADEFLYVVAGEASGNGTYTAGKFLIEFYGI